MKKLLPICFKSLLLILFFTSLIFLFPRKIQASCPGTVITTDYLDVPLSGITITCTNCETDQNQCTSGEDGTCLIDFGQTCLWPCTYYLTSDNPNCVLQETGYGVDCSDPEVPPTMRIICEPWPGTPTPETLPPPGTYNNTCTISSEDKRTSWPEGAPPGYCPGCNETGYLTYSCFQSFDVQATLNKIPASECDVQCDGNWYAQIPWSAQITVDPQEVEVPFAGKKTEFHQYHSGSPVMRYNYEDEITYLADYLEGTHEYYRDYAVNLFPEIGAHRADWWGENPNFLANYMGVMRKLTPYEFQNQMKRNMIQRLEWSQQGQIASGQIRNYNLHYMNRLCWQAPFLTQVADEFLPGILKHLPLFNKLPIPEDLTLWYALNYCLYDPTGGAGWIIGLEGTLTESIMKLAKLFPILRYFAFDINRETQEQAKLSAFFTDFENRSPPLTTEENYAEKWDEWKEYDDKKWSKLWQVIPLVTREDTEARIYAHPELRTSNESWEGESSGDIKVPHLARLWETSRVVQQTLLPESENLVRASDEPLLAQNAPNPNITLLTSTDTDFCGNNDQNSLVFSNGCSMGSQVLGEKKILAQEEGGYTPVVAASGSCFHQGGNNYYFTLYASYTFPWLIEGCGYGDIFTEIAPGVGLFCSAHFACQNQSTSWTITGSPGQSLPLNLFIHASRTGPIDPCHITYPQEWNIGLSINIHDDGTCSVSGGGLVPPPSPTPTPCGFVPRSDECIQVSIPGVDPMDQVCSINNLTGILNAVEEIENPNCVCFEDGVDCEENPDHFCCKSEFTPLETSTSRQIEMSSQLPYLTESRNQTIGSFEGFFNIFRPGGPQGIDEFDDLPARSSINYRLDFCRSSYGIENCDIFPGQGEFYFPYLGGIQLSKEWVSTKALIPYLEY